jgi:signal transduction histidine kinase
VPDHRSAPLAGPVLILTPTGRDAEGAAQLLAREKLEPRIAPSLDRLSEAFDDATGLIVLADEALFQVNLTPLVRRLTDQPAWSDIPIIVLTRGGIGMRRLMAELNLPAKLGNVLFLERPLNSLTLLSAVKTALRARRRQWQVRDYLADQARVAEQATALLEARVAERTAALETAEQERRRIAAALVQSQRLEALGKLAAGIAHDFNNVLQAVSGGISLIEKRATDVERVRQLARMIGDAAGRGAAITGRLLAFARQGELQAVPVQTTLLLESLREMLVPTLGVAIAVHVELPLDVPSLLADRTQLETVLVNLASNARDAMPGGGNLTISAQPETIGESHRIAALQPGAYVRLELRDNGSGMDPATLARASEPFFTTKPVGQGTGLGLAMARGFAEQSGGGFAIESVLGVGTTVVMWFPQAGDGAATSSEPDGPILHGAVVFLVMVVDDDPLVREVLAGQLQEQGYRIVQAPDGLAALAWLERNGQPDLLVTDFAMPGMNGLTLIREARRRYNELPALLLTGYADANVQSAIESQQDRNIFFLRKPVRNSELAKQAAALLRG